MFADLIQRCKIYTLLQMYPHLKPLQINVKHKKTNSNNTSSFLFVKDLFDTFLYFYDAMEAILYFLILNVT